MVGSHLVDYYYDLGMPFSGTLFRPTIDIRDIKHKGNLVKCDVRNFNRVLAIMEKLKPDIVYHLAAQSYPTVSWEKPHETIESNVLGTINVFEAVKRIRKKKKKYDPLIVVACSSAEYGATLTPENVPIREDMLLQPLHPYGVSKVAQDQLAFQYFVNDGIRSIRARIFNTTGPRKTNDVASDFTKRAILVEKGKEQYLRVGNLETRRAITDVRDLISALALLAEKGRAGETYNISGNSVYRIGDILPIIEKNLTCRLKVKADKSLLRSSDEPIIYGDSTKLKNDTGWQQSYSLDTTIKDMLNYWRMRV